MSTTKFKSQSGNVSGSTSATVAAQADWLLLTDYASKYRISVSTLRRRIKTGQQPYRFDGGRYYLPDQLNTSPSITELEESSPEPSPTKPPQTAAAILAASIEPKDEPLITTTSKLLNELKQAYTLILHEKEEQIVYLKEEIADLKTLVRVLESENARHASDRRRADAPSAKKPLGNA